MKTFVLDKIEIKNMFIVSYTCSYNVSGRNQMCLCLTISKLISAKRSKIASHWNICNLSSFRPTKARRIERQIYIGTPINIESGDVRQFCVQFNANSPK